MLVEIFMHRVSIEVQQRFEMSLVVILSWRLSFKIVKNKPSVSVGFKNLTHHLYLHFNNPLPKPSVESAEFFLVEIYLQHKSHTFWSQFCILVRNIQATLYTVAALSVTYLLCSLMPPTTME